MLPNPLHPAVVHFPVVLMFLIPLFAAGALWAIRRGTNPLRAWLLPVVLSAALALSALVAVRTGESQTERVERVVSEQPLESHEEAAEAFLTLTAVLVVVSAVGLARGVVGRLARLVATAGAIAVAVVGARVGHSGGELVYRYGAASAYTTTSTTEAGGSVERAGHETRERER